MAYAMARAFCRTFKMSFCSAVNTSLVSSDVNIRISNYTTLKSNSSNEDKKESSTSKSVEKKVYITLVGTDDIPKPSTLEAAQKFSKRRALRLVKVSDYDPRRQTPVYKLLTGSQILGEDISHKKENKGKTGFKSEKIISLSHNISDHDLHSKVQQILKWIQKRHEVRATISGSPSDSRLAESTFQKVEADLKNNGRILQKRSSGGDVKFQLIPLKEKKNQIENSDENSSKMT